MKRLLATVTAALLLCLPLAPLPLLSTGCVTAQEASYKTLKVTWETVHASMLAYADLNAAGKVSASDRAFVVQLHNDYRHAFDIAITAAQLNWETATPADVASLALELVNFVQSLKR
jgi:hypothetical protein